jgi:hypothetical protein
MAAFAGMFSKFDSQGVVYWAEKRDERFLLQACRLNLGETLADLMPELRLYTSATIGYWPFADFPSRKSDLIQRGFFNRFLGDALPLAEEGSVDCNIFFLSVQLSRTRGALCTRTPADSRTRFASTRAGRIFRQARRRNCGADFSLRRRGFGTFYIQLQSAAGSRKARDADRSRSHFAARRRRAGFARALSPQQRIYPAWARNLSGRASTSRATACGY